MDHGYNFVIVVLSFVFIVSPTIILANDQSIYQPTKQEIERFQVIQEQIRHHQQEEQRERERKKKLAQEEMDRIRQENQIQPRHPAESLLIPHSALVPMFMHKQQIYSDHRVPMPPQVQVPHLPFSSPPQLGYNHPQSMVMPLNHYPPQSMSMPIMPEMNQLYNPYNMDDKMRNSRIQMNNNEHLIGERNNRKQYDQEKHADQEDFDNKIDKLAERGVDTEMSEASRFDKSRPHSLEDSNRYGHRYRCYSCQWNIAHCSDFNCYNNPDICTTNNFAPNLVQQADCPGGCEQFVITDPNGLTQQWKRGCAQPGSFPIVRMRCNTYYEFGVRIDRCVCNNDWCNASTRIVSKQSSILLFISFIITIIIIIF
ncbi:hypothetical protein BLA29_002510 [Euroglyphus maynei]|uniref:Protein quiver n=1 Tax=Euroglyphus maynei TaxID=6958 RepID=A0A1Y3BAT1_EURMA|nr:hypothetical protein BLA29_002510 [Euroglyphus maynei]